jgi:hypothetical protein
VAHRLGWLAISLVVSALACTTSPTGRSQLAVFPEAQMNQMGIAAFDQLKKQTHDSGVKNCVRCVAGAHGERSGVRRALSGGGVPGGNQRLRAARRQIGAHRLSGGEEPGPTAA